MAINPYDLAAVRNARMKKPSAVIAMKRRIRELEAELQVRDNMGNEVLRILREATGKRDFHSEMEAAEWAAKMLAEARKDSARLAFVLDIDNDQIQWSSVPWFGEAIDHIVSQQPKTKTDWESKWLEVVRKHIDAAIDAASKEAK
jgi:hypothetical protein